MQRVIDAAKQVRHWIRRRLSVARQAEWHSDRAPMGEPEALVALHNPAPIRRWQAAISLGRNPQRSPKAIAALVAALADTEPFVRWQASEALAAQETSRVFQVLVQTLAETEPLRRAGAAASLGRMGGEAACLALGKCSADPDACVRAAVADALGVCGDPTSLPVLLPMLADPEPDVRRAAGRSLGRVGDPGAAALIAENLAQAGQPVLVRRALAAALASAPHPDARPALLSALHDPDPQVRGYAAQALGQIGDEASYAALAALRADVSPLLRGTVGDQARQALTMLERRGRRVP